MHSSFVNALRHVPHVISRSAPRGTRVARCDRLQHAYLVIQEGAVGIVPGHGALDSEILDVLGPGACLGPRLNQVLGEAGAGCAVYALSDVRLLEISEAAFQQQLVRDPALGAVALHALERQHAATARWVELLRLREPLLRLAGTLLHLSEMMAQPCPIAAGRRLMLPQHLIAAVAGLSRQTVNEHLHQLSAAGNLQVERGMICVLRPESLGAIVHGHAKAPPRQHGQNALRRCQLRHPTAALECPPQPVPLSPRRRW